MPTALDKACWQLLLTIALEVNISRQFVTYVAHRESAATAWNNQQLYKVSDIL